MTRRVLVCGGRNYSDAAHVALILNARHKSDPISLLIHGGASGADSLAGQWAQDNGVPVHAYLADWRRYGKSAGPIRNLHMLADSRPDLVIAFAGGAGTAHMRRIARAHGVEVVDVKAIASAPPSTQGAAA